MHELNRLINEIGISKVRLAKYLGVSRQMLYNYLALENLESWPKEKAVITTRIICRLAIRIYAN